MPLKNRSLKIGNNQVYYNSWLFCDYSAEITKYYRRNNAGRMGETNAKSSEFT